MTTRLEVVSKAREYVGTPFQHQGRVKGLAIDCVGLLLCVGNDLGLKDINGAEILKFDYKDYSPQPMGRFVHDRCRERLRIKQITDLKSGDVVSMRVPADPCHVGILSERFGALYLIHAYSAGEKPTCVEHILDEPWRRRIAGVFQFPDVED